MIDSATLGFKDPHEFEFDDQKMLGMGVGCDTSEGTKTTTWITQALLNKAIP